MEPVFSVLPDYNFLVVTRLRDRLAITIKTEFSMVLVVVLIICSMPAQAGSVITIPQSNPNFKVEQVAQGLGVPWGMDFLSNRELIFTERQGNVKILNLDNMEIIGVRGVAEVVAEGQGGMLDVAKSTENGWLYFTYSKGTPSGAVTTLARARRTGNRFSEWQDLLITASATETSRHFGSRIAFDANGHIFFGVGDRGKRVNAQNLKNHAGTIMRLRLDGSTPDDNPFLNNPDVLPEIWSYGHRNPQGLLYDTNKGKLWSIEHGPRGGDEINLVKKGRNYGWPVISYGKEYWGPVSVGEGTQKPGMEQPVKVYIPSIAPGSLLLYSAKAFPQWRGDLFSGALKLRHLNRVSISSDNKATDEERLLEDLNERIRALTVSAEGWIYFSTDSGKIMRMRPRE